MKYFIILTILLSQLSFASGIGEYSSGYRIGLITKFSEKGLFVKSGEGQMLMGSDSTPYIITSKDSDGNKTTKTINPWYFSSVDESITSELYSIVGNYALLEYKQSHIKGFSTDTSYIISNISNISKPTNQVCETADYISGSRSEGTRVGRIVKMSKKGTFVNSNEIMFQQGFSGNQFKNMSITGDEMYECALNFLKSGQKVKIIYSESLVNIDILGRNTNYDIIRIEPLTSGLN